MTPSPPESPTPSDTITLGAGFSTCEFFGGDIKIPSIAVMVKRGVWSLHNNHQRGTLFS